MNLPIRFYNRPTEKPLRAGIVDQKGRRGAKALAPEADFACFQEQNPLNSNVREALILRQYLPIRAGTENLPFEPKRGEVLRF